MLFGSDPGEMTRDRIGRMLFRALALRHASAIEANGPSISLRVGMCRAWEPRTEAGLPGAGRRSGPGT